MGWSHRDLKPENLFLQRAGSDAGDGKPRVKVLDFGLARLLDGQTMTSYGLALGTPSFMSPEQAAGRIDEIDGRTDLFALAATGFRLRTGRRIHEGANAVELVAKMAHFAAPKIEAYAPDVAGPFARVIDRALEFRREDRYANAAEMREDVRRAIAEMDGEAKTVMAVFPPPSVPPPRMPPPPPPVRREATMEVSERDLERPSLPVLPTQPRRQKRRSILPWVTLALFTAIAIKLWLDGRAEAPRVEPPESTSASEPEPESSDTAPTVALSPAPPPAPVPSSAPPPAPAPTSVATPPPSHVFVPFPGQHLSTPPRKLPPGKHPPRSH